MVVVVFVVVGSGGDGSPCELLSSSTNGAGEEETSVALDTLAKEGFTGKRFLRQISTEEKILISHSDKHQFQLSQ
ncbi:hypothetical protein OnM2_03869 [Erysiphe neolycopersici]|uniref:Uncharacterized protein n=1 Tax=Erysiphe neolycopersici TaxID=212602 RepID=A0A420HNH9_9PEZI|nr:hypothetical protein OnM2_03869 [Erysiphe neolycopersici]